MKEKTKVIESTQGLGNDLAGVMALQRKLTGMERDLEAIQVCGRWCAQAPSSGMKMEIY